MSTFTTYDGLTVHDADDEDVVDPFDADIADLAEAQDMTERHLREMGVAFG